MSPIKILLKDSTKLVVYTALFGDYDDLADPEERFDGCEFICFTDRCNLSSDIWRIVFVGNNSLAPNMMNRNYKLQPYLFIDNIGRSIYIDSNVIVKSHPEEWIKTDGCSIQIPAHFLRTCIFDEASEVIKSKKAPAERVMLQMSFYKTLGMPRNFGLSENNVIYRDFRDPSVRAIMEEWWLELNKFTQRDQLSLMFVLWRNSYKIHLSNVGARGNKYFSIRPHLSSRFKSSFYGKFKYFLVSYIENNPRSILVDTAYRLNYLLKYLRLF